MSALTEQQIRFIVRDELRIILDKGLMYSASTNPQTQNQPQPAQQPAAVQELTFSTLKYDAVHSDKMGDYEIALIQSNVGDKWRSAYNVLNASNATIKERYHGPGYVYAYWLYGEGKIYRQKLKEKT